MRAVQRVLEPIGDQRIRRPLGDQSKEPSLTAPRTTIRTRRPVLARISQTPPPPTYAIIRPSGDRRGDRTLHLSADRHGRQSKRAKSLARRPHSRGHQCGRVYAKFLPSGLKENRPNTPSGPGSKGRSRWPPPSASTTAGRLRLANNSRRPSADQTGSPGRAPSPQPASTPTSLPSGAIDTIELSEHRGSQSIPAAIRPFLPGNPASATSASNHETRGDRR